VAHKACKNKKRAHIDNCIRNIEGNIKDKHMRNACKEAGSLKGGFKPHTDLCRGINNETLANAEDIKTRWRTYFQELLNTVVAEHDSFLDNTHINQIATEEELEEEPPSISDIEIAMQSVSNSISPGIGNIPAEFYQKGGQLLMNKVHRLINMDRREIAYRLENENHSANIQKQE
jgi:hypothetical protein